MKKGQEKFKRFLKKYGYYCLAGVLTIAMATTIALMPSPEKDKIDNNLETEIPVQNQTLTFGLPAENATLIKGFSDSTLQYNMTMKQWEVHKGVDLTSDNVAVFSVLDGTVASVSYNFEEGTCISIAHDGGYTSRYSSLANEPEVKVGDRVKKGDKIGEMSDSSNEESEDGKHVHLELFKDNTQVDPSNYIQFDLK